MPLYGRDLDAVEKALNDAWRKGHKFVANEMFDRKGNSIGFNWRQCGALNLRGQKCLMPPDHGRHGTEVVRFKVMWQQDGRWHWRYVVRGDVEAAVVTAKKIDANAYAVVQS